MTAAETQERTELDRVEAWRQEELERAGYGVAAAQELAQRHDVDLHSAVALLQRGCPQDVALQILL
jgi:hypothetical protein